MEAALSLFSFCFTDSGALFKHIQDSYTFYSFLFDVVLIVVFCHAVDYIVGMCGLYTWVGIVFVGMLGQQEKDGRADWCVARYTQLHLNLECSQSLWMYISGCT